MWFGVDTGRMVIGEQRTNLVNVARFAVRNPGLVGVLARKVARRVADERGFRGRREMMLWLEARAQDPELFAQSVDPELWVEAVEVGRRLEARAEAVLGGGPELGAGADWRFLYWLTRRIRPGTVVETGVGAGWSSAAFLEALERNGCGALHSSDLPYFRLKDPEQWVGCLVEDRVRHNWRLHLGGDQANLPRILGEAGPVDLFHYDSDKTDAGRRFAIELVWPRLPQGGVVVMDDITNNSFFVDWAERSGWECRVFGDPPRFGVLGRI